MKKFEWKIIPGLTTQSENWYRKKVPDVAECTSCRNERKFDFYQYGISENGSDIFPIGGAVCNRLCLSDKARARFAKQSRLHRDPEIGARRERFISLHYSRRSEIIDLHASDKGGWGSIARTADKMHISRQRVHSILLRHYGRGNIPNERRTANG